MKNQEASKYDWEYKVIKLSSSSANSAEEVLNELGSEGWELVTFQPHGDHAYAGEGTYFLKRVKG